MRIDVYYTDGYTQSYRWPTALRGLRRPCGRPAAILISEVGEQLEEEAVRMASWAVHPLTGFVGVVV